MDKADLLSTDPGPNIDLLEAEFKQAGIYGGLWDLAYHEETRRMLWAGQSPDGRKWDEYQAEGHPTLPWNGCSDTRVPVVDGVVNDEVALLTAAFWKAELRADTVNSDNLELSGAVSDYLHWLVHTKLRKALRLEVELAAQYSREYGYCVAFVGWERELGKRRKPVTLAQLTQLAGQFPPESPITLTPQLLMDPTQDEGTAQLIQALFKMYVTQDMSTAGFFETELADENLLMLPAATARRCVRELRESGETMIPMPFVCENRPLVWVAKPNIEVLAARGTLQLKKARAIFWRRWLTEAELLAKAAEGWDEEWIEKVKETKGQISTWAAAVDAPGNAGPGTKTVGDTRFIKLSQPQHPLIEVVYAFVKKVDEDGVTGVYQTIFSPHLTKNGTTEDFCAVHELLDYAHGQYPFVELKRENLGRGLTESRSVSEVAGTWQVEEKTQRDMLANRANLDTLPPFRVPKLGGVDYRLGPGALVPMGKSQEIEAINFGAPPPTLALELIQLLRAQRDDYFGLFAQDVNPAKVAIKQEKAVGDFYTFWGEVLLQVFALSLQYHPQELVAVTGNPAIGMVDPFTVLEQMQIGLAFDPKDLHPDYLMQKLDIIHSKILPSDVTGAIDRSGLTAWETRVIDGNLSRRILQDKGQASQKVYDDVQLQLSQMMLGFEAKYVENDPTAGMKLQFMQNLMQSNPKVQQWLKADVRFKELMENYVKNLQMSVAQQQNKQVGRIGVKPVGAPAS